MRKIAVSGMKGRKKDTLLLAFVVLLSFLFIITAIGLYSSSEKTKNTERTTTFGTWQNSYLNVKDNEGERLVKLEEIDQLGKSRLVGRSNRLGTVGTFNEELLDLGHFQLHEGRFPETDNEIALELNQLSHFSQDVQIGDTISVEITIPLYELDRETAELKQMEKLEAELRKYDEEILSYINSDEWEDRPNLGLDYTLNSIIFVRDMLKLEDNEPTPISALYDYLGNKIERNERTLESFDGTEVVTKTSYLYSSLESDEGIEDNIETVKRDGTIISESVNIRREMVVSGIIQTYSNLWDADKFPLANSFITEEAGKSFIENGFYLSGEMDLSDYDFYNNYFIKSKISADEFYNRYNSEFDNLRKNSYAYPDMAGSTEGTLTYSILGFIFIGTIFSVFQIYLTQMKRRTRKIALLKSIGATNKQIRKVLIWETLYLLLFIIPISIIGGILIVKLILKAMNTFGNTNLDFYIDYNLMILGMIVGIISVILGMSIPMIKSLRIPLTGTISTEPKGKKNYKRKKLNKNSIDLNIKVQTFSKISLKNLRYNKSNLILTLSLYTITISVLLSSIFLGFLAFGDYRDKVIATNKPDYSFEFDFGMREREIPEYIEELKGISGVKDVQLYKSGEHAYMWYEGIENNQIQSKFKSILPTNLLDEHFGVNKLDYENLDGDLEYLVKDSIVVNTYGIDMEDKLFKKFIQSINMGDIDEKKIEEGSQVIVLMPLYLPLDDGEEHHGIITDYSVLQNTEQKNRMKNLLEYSNLYDLNYDFRYKDYFLKDESLSPGDIISVSVPTEKVSGSTKTNELAFHQIEVGGIIYYFPEEGIWPFSDSIENPVLIGSYGLVTNLYPSSFGGKGRLSIEELRGLISSLAPTRYGKTWVYVDLESKVDDIQVQVDLQRLSLEKESKIYNHTESNKIIYGKGLKMASVIIILGLSITFITLIILYNTTLSKLEQERERIGILQAIGVTGGQFKKLYIFTGIFYGLISIMIAHIFMSLVVLITTVGYHGPLLINAKNQLWLYPWKLHILICLVYFLITILTYYIPIRKIVKNQPVNNIRSLAN